MAPGTSLTAQFSVLSTSGKDGAWYQPNSTVLSTSGEDGAWNQPDSTVLSTSGEDGAWNQPDITVLSTSGEAFRGSEGVDFLHLGHLDI